ncbi:MAG: hypothetical protein K940chlam2_00337 [Chlamydiae bacterium]|nr:hypothetical protein [Chlamydiota bacterium]
MSHDFLIKEGDKYKDFTLVSYTPIKELKSVLRELVHHPTGAQVMHIENEDPENLFCLSFKTLPSNSNGVAHILEHTTLCGSRLFPVKDPFFAMHRRSLNTFMNAMTGSDFTCYPASTQVEKDFYNLLDVYLDAVFHPLLKETSFLQEGHRLEFANPEDPSTPLEVKGIVYNEMKGSLSSVDNYLWHEMIARLVPDLPYAHNAGGDPKEIPDLTYRQLIEFHEAYYHPSRCLFYFYGNFPLQKHLDVLAEKALKKISPLSPLDGIGHQPRFKKPVQATLPYSTNETEGLENKSIHVFGWLTTMLQNQEEVIALTVLDSILMDTDASPLKKSLLDSGLCVSAESYIDGEMTEIPLVIVCRGAKKEAAEKLELHIRTKLGEIAREGIPFHLVESVIHQLEFGRMEITGDHSPFGLTLFMRSALAKQHGCDPKHALTLHEVFEELVEKARDPMFFTPLIEKYLLQNSHFVSLSLDPDPGFDARSIVQEKERLAKRKEKVTEKEIAHILKQTKELTTFQAIKEGASLECLPKVSLSDVPAETREFTLTSEKRGAFEIFHHDAFTNHIAYVDLIFDIPTLTLEEHFDLQMLCILSAELGVGKRTYDENLEYIQAHTGGVGAYASLQVQVNDPSTMTPTLQLRGKALERKLPQLFELLTDMIKNPRFDEETRLNELIQKVAHSMQSGLSRGAMGYASKLALSGLSPAGYLSNLWHGLPFYQEVQTLAKDTKNYGKRLAHIAEKIYCRGNPHLVLSCDREIYDTIDKEGFYGLPNLSMGPQSAPFQYDFDLPEVPDQIRLISSQVAFTVSGQKGAGYCNPLAPPLAISTELMESKLLHHRIREQGGAYGAGASYNAIWGHFYFYTYRDPHIAHSLNSFQAAIEEIAAGNFDENDLEGAKLGIIQHLDLPISPGSRAIVSYIWQRDGKTRQRRQAFRDNLLNLSKKDIQEAVQSELLGKKRTICIFAGEELASRENEKLTPPLPIKKIS